MLCGLTKDQQHENSTFTYDEIFFFAVANENYGAVQRFKSDSKGKGIWAEPVLPNLSDSVKTVELVKEALQKYGLKCRELDTSKENWNSNPETKDGDANPNVIILENATKRKIDQGFEALTALQKRSNKKRLCFFLFLGHGMTNTGMQIFFSTQIRDSVKDSLRNRFFESVNLE